jgi:hypothetical protein
MRRGEPDRAVQRQPASILPLVTDVVLTHMHMDHVAGLLVDRLGDGCVRTCASTRLTPRPNSARRPKDLFDLYNQNTNMSVQGAGWSMGFESVYLLMCDAYTKIAPNRQKPPMPMRSR